MSDERSNEGVDFGETAPELQAEPAPSFASGFAACGNIFFAPNDVFRKVARGLSFWPGLILLVIAAVLIAHFQMPLQLEAMRLQTESGGVGPGGEAFSESMETWIRGASYIGPVLFVPVMLLVSTFFYWLAFLLAFGGAPFKRLYSLTVYCACIGFLYQGLNVLYLRLTDPEFGNAQELAASALNLSLSAFLTDSTSFLGGFLSQVGLFPIWDLTLYVFGAAILLRRSRQAVLAPALVIFLLGALVAALLTKLGSAFG